MLDNAHSGSELQASVAAELDWDPKLDIQDISVITDGGAVTLSGTVTSLWHVREALNAAQRVKGVTSVSNRLTVRPVMAGQAEDREVSTAVQQALMLNSAIPDTVNAQVRNGVVRLTGTTTWHWQREEAEHGCAAVAGVLAIANDVKLVPAPVDHDMQQSTMAALRRSAPLSLQDLSVDALDSGVVILSGIVTTWAEHDEAVAAAWSARGVDRVCDRIEVMY